MNRMMKLLIGLLFSAACMQSFAADVFISVNADGDVTVDWTHQPCVSPKSGWEDEFLVSQPYEIKYKKESAALWEEKFYSDGSLVFIPAAFLDWGYTYKFKVRYYGKDADCRGLTRVRTIDTVLYHYDVAIFQEAQIIPGRSMKIHGVAYDKCLYPYTWAGGPISSVRLHHWGCYDEDAKAFIIEDLGSSRVRMHSQVLIEPYTCIVPQPAFVGDYAMLSPEIGVNDCYIPNASYIRVADSPGIFRLQNEVNGRCLIASSDADGAPLTQGTCSTNDQRQLFFFEDF